MYLSRALRLASGAADKEVLARLNLTWGQVELEDEKGDLAVGLANTGRAVEKAEALMWGGARERDRESPRRAVWRPVGHLMNRTGTRS